VSIISLSLSLSLSLSCVRIKQPLFI
jgi:hypothetical protein